MKLSVESILEAYKNLKTVQEENTPLQKLHSNGLELYEGVGFLVPSWPVYGFTLPLVDQLSCVELFGLDLWWGST